MNENIRPLEKMKLQIKLLVPTLILGFLIGWFVKDFNASETKGNKLEKTQQLKWQHRIFGGPQDDSEWELVSTYWSGNVLKWVHRRAIDPNNRKPSSWINPQDVETGFSTYEQVVEIYGKPEKEVPIDMKETTGVEYTAYKWKIGDRRGFTLHFDKNNICQQKTSYGF